MKCLSVVKVLDQLREDNAYSRDSVQRVIKTHEDILDAYPTDLLDLPAAVAHHGEISKFVTSLKALLNYLEQTKYILEQKQPEQLLWFDLDESQTASDLAEQLSIDLNTTVGPADLHKVTHGNQSFIWDCHSADAAFMNKLKIA